MLLVVFLFVLLPVLFILGRWFWLWTPFLRLALGFYHVILIFLICRWSFLLVIWIDKSILYFLFSRLIRLAIPFLGILIMLWCFFLLGLPLWWIIGVGFVVWRLGLHLIRWFRLITFQLRLLCPLLCSFSNHLILKKLFSCKFIKIINLFVLFFLFIYFIFFWIYLHLSFSL